MIESVTYNGWTFSRETFDTITGTGGDDVIVIDGHSVTGTIRTFAGNDLISGPWHYGVNPASTGDWIETGDGDDTVRGPASNSVVIAGAGNDNISMTAGPSVAILGDGDDFFRGSSGNDTAFGGAGNDNLWGESGSDWLEGGDGDDLLVGGAERDSFFSIPWDASATILPDDDTLIGGAGNDTLTSGEGNDVMTGGTGSDTFFFDNIWETYDPRTSISGYYFAGHDVVTDFDPTEDTVLFSGVVNSIWNTSAGAMASVGPLGSTVLFMGRSADEMRLAIWLESRGTNGNDVADMSTLNFPGHPLNPATYYALGGNDYVTGREGNDWIHGGAGNDTLLGMAGADEIRGGDGNDLIYGGGGWAPGYSGDTLYGGAGNDTLIGGDSNDRLYGGKGDDVLTGGAGADYFSFTSEPGGLGHDIVTDFELGMDSLRLMTTAYTLEDTSEGALVRFDSGTSTILVLGVMVADFTHTGTWIG